MTTSTPIEQALLEAGVVDAEAVEKGRAYREQRGGTITEALASLKLAEPEALARAVAGYAHLPFVERIDPDTVPADLLESVPIQFAKKNRLLPIAEEEGEIVVALADLDALEALADLRVLFSRPVRPCIAAAPEILSATNRVYAMGSEGAGNLIEGIADEEWNALAQGMEEPEDLLDASDEAPVIRLVNGMLSQAVKDRASDIHIEPFERELVVRYRIDGILYKVLSPPKVLQSPIVSRVKIMAGLDIAEKRLPQDGRIRIKIAGKDIDVRVSVLPTAFGERVVLRLLDKTSVLLELEELGLEGPRLETFRSLIAKPHGILLVTGPTGSGKTTTLYSALTRINHDDVNIITVEDPIEYQIKGIGQIHVNPKIDLTFAAGLRSILRQDPDVIMVGEIRDTETAEIAIQASLTGHLVFSTLHTNDAASAVTRLIEMGVEPFLVSSSVLAILAQRLVRVLCPACRVPYVPTADELRELGLAPAALPHGVLYRAAGCAACRHTGYRGRTGIYELLILDEEVRSHIMRGSDSTAIKKAAMKNGMTALRSDGAHKAAMGITSAEEVIRVTQEET